MRNVDTEGEIVKTNCQGCQLGCGVLVHVKEGRVVKIEGNPEHPLNRGMICPKSMGYKQILYHPDRLKYPLKRVGERGEGKWQRISWDEALDTIARELTETMEKYSPKSIAFSVGGNLRRNRPATRILADSLGTPNWSYTDAMYCFGPHIVGEYFTFGVTRVMDEYNTDCANSKCAIVWGGNPVHTQITYMQKLLRAKTEGAHIKLIVIDPIFTATASKADIWLQLRPGTDCALALGMLNVIINEGLYDKEFVKRWCTGFEELKKRVQDYSPERVAEITWVSADDIKNVARTYATSKPASMYLRVATEMTFNSTQTSRAVACLVGITGNLDVKGGNIYNSLPPGFKWYHFYHLKKWRLPDEVELERLGAKDYPLLCGPRSAWGLYNTCSVIKAVLTGKPYPVKAMVVANNPLLSMPNTREVYKALTKLEFLVVQELFMTPTAELGDIVLPAATWLEMEQINSYPPNFISASRKAIEPVGECWDEMKITYEILKRMGLKFSIWPELNSPEEYDDFILKEIGMTFDDLKQRDYITPQIEYKKYERDGFKTPSGKVELYSSVFKEFGYDPLPHYVEPFESPVSTPELAKEYPLILISGGRQLPYYHSLGHEVPWMRELVPDPQMEIHPQTAKELGIKEGDWVWIETPRGEGRIKQKAKLTLGIHPKVVHFRAHWWYPEKQTPDHGLWESNINVLTSCDPPLEPICGTPTMRGLLCKVYKVAEGEK